MKDTITERIKKLLRLAGDKRGNTHEAERALQLAYELAEKHRIDMQGLDLDEETTRLVDEYWPVGARLDQLRRGVFGILQDHFHVTVCLDRPRMLVIGRQQDVVIARYVHDFLLRAGRQCLRSFADREQAARRRMTTAKRAGFYAGFLWGVRFKLMDSREAIPLTDAQSALVLAEESTRKARLHDLVPNMEKLPALKKRQNETAANAGFIAGEATTINQPLGAESRGTLLLG